ncbi:TatD family hydrolase [Candidatus Saccharibacteria bacterium]|nr:TatD family hydrolase [Candidatus Saccharibacteria bacterium]
MLIDAHCHLHDREFFTEEQAEEMIKRAFKVGVKKIICIGTDPEDSLAACDFANKHDGVYWTYGVHPENAKSCAAALRTPLRRDKLVAIGEVGLDYHYDGFDREAQIKLFEEMLQLAVENDLPISFHVREAFPDFFDTVAKYPTVRGVVHSFTDSKKVLKRILNETNFYIGVNGLATYSTLPTPPLDRIILETDAPFLAPVPYRGETNEPAYIADIAKWLADKLGVSVEEVADATTENVNTLFKLTK